MSASRKPLELTPPRLGALARLPVFFALTGKRAVLVGGGQAAAWKLELLEAAGAQVQVYAVDEWSADDLRGAAIAVGAFDSDAEAKRFCDAARGAGVPVNVIDRPAFCDFSFGAIVNRSPLVIGISTDGAAPVFAQAIRAKLEALLPNGFAAWASAAARWRDAVKAAGLPFAGRRKFWQLFTAHAMRQPDSEPGQADFDSFIAEVKGLGAAVENGSVTLVGAGPGDPELLTLRAVRALQSADIILFDDLVSHDVLDFARREARKMLVGKTGYGPSCKQDEINALMVEPRQAGQARGPSQGRRSADLRPRRRGDRRLQGRRHRRRGRARHHRGAGRGGETRAFAHRARAGPPPAIRHRPCPRGRRARRHRLARARRSGHHHGDLYAGKDAGRAGGARGRARPRSRKPPRSPSRARPGPIRRWSQGRSANCPRCWRRPPCRGRCWS